MPTDLQLDTPEGRVQFPLRSWPHSSLVRARLPVRHTSLPGPDTSRVNAHGTTSLQIDPYVSWIPCHPSPNPPRRRGARLTHQPGECRWTSCLPSPRCGFDSRHCRKAM
jgi:hypothetical protein